MRLFGARGVLPAALCPHGCPHKGRYRAAQKRAGNHCEASGFPAASTLRERRIFGPLQALTALLYAARRDPLGVSLFLGSSAVEHSTVNRMVAGSNPARGAKCSQSTIPIFRFAVFFARACDRDFSRARASSSLLEHRPAGVAEARPLSPQAVGDGPHIGDFAGAEPIDVGRAGPLLFRGREIGPRGACRRQRENEGYSRSEVGTAGFRRTECKSGLHDSNPLSWAGTTAAPQSSAKYRKYRSPNVIFLTFGLARNRVLFPALKHS
jgi:hypothetical protein